MTYEEQDGRWTTPNGRPITFRYRADTNDWNTLTASLDEDEYGLAGLAMAGPVVDIGGYLGSVGIGLAVDHPDAQVTIIEPVPANAALIRHNAEANGVQVTVIEGAVGKGSVEVSFAYRGTDAAEHHAFVGNSSLGYGLLDHETVEYDGLSLRDVLGSGIGLLKIDCEGGEWAFLDAPAAQLRKVERIVGEAHALMGHVGGDIVALLSATHDVTLTGDPAGTCGFAAALR